MKIWNLSARTLGVVGASFAAVLLSPMLNQRASAFGGFWSSQSGPVKQAAQRVIFVDNPDATITALVQLRYQGSAQKFAWVIPVPGRPTVGVSSSVVFDRLDAATAPQYWLEVSVSGTALSGMCMRQTYPQTPPVEDAGLASASSPDAATPPITIIDQGSVGPYDYVTLAADKSLADPAKVATDWLTTNGYELTALDSKVLSPYLSQGFNLLAFRLTNGADRGSIRPVSLTYESTLPRIPIIPTAVATQADLGVQVWVLGPSQAVPENYKSLVLNDALIDWLRGQKFAAGTPPAGGGGPTVPYFGRPSNYDAVVSAAANEAGGQGFVTELAEPASQFRDAIWSAVDAGNFMALSSQEYADGVDAVLAASSYYADWDGFRESLQGATMLPDGVTIDAFSSHPELYRGLAHVDVSKLFELLHTNVVDPVADAGALFFNGPYLTRLYTTMSADEMTVDPSFNYNLDLTQVSNVHVARQTVQCAPMLSQADAPWRIDLPQGGVIAGAGDGAWPVTLGSMPTNLKVVTLSESGPGTVNSDNSAQIASALFGAATLIVDTTTPRPPQTGSAIGGTQRVTPPVPLASIRGASTPAPADSCQVSRVGAGSRSAFAFMLPFIAALLTRRRLFVRACSPAQARRARGSR